MTVARLVFVLPDLGVVGAGMSISVPEDTTAVFDAADALRNSQPGDRIHLWKDVDLVGPLDRLGEPHAELLMGDGGWMRVLRHLGPGGQRDADHVVSDAVTARWIKPLPNDGLWAVITCAFYAAVDAPDRCYVEQEVEYLVARDPGEPGGTEVWSNCEYIDMCDARGDAVAARDEAAADVEAPNDDEWNTYAGGVYPIR